MTQRYFADWLDGYIQYTSAAESPLSFHFWSGISAIAGALRGKVYRDEKTFRWTPNFYIVLVGPPAVAKKSTSMGLALRLLEEIDGIHFGPESATWQSLAQRMQMAGETFEFKDEMGNDTKLDLSCVTLGVSELGTFLKIASEGFTDVLIDMWDGQVRTRPWQHSTVSSSQISIKNPWLNLIACTTPSWLRLNFPEHMIGGGLTSRIVFVWGDAPRHHIAYPSLSYKPNEFELLRFRLIEDLKRIAALAGPVALSPEAIEYGTAWYENMMLVRPPHLIDGRYDSYYGRKQVFLHKLAIIRMAATGDVLRLEREHLEWADKVLDNVERGMIRVFRSIGLVEEATHVDQLVRLLQGYKQLTPDQLFAFVSQNISYPDFKNALTSAVKSGQIVYESTLVNGISTAVVRTSISSN